MAKASLLRRMSHRPYLYSGTVLIFGAIAHSSLSFAEDELELFYSYYTDSSGLDVTSPNIYLSKEITDQSSFSFLYLRETFAKSAQGDGTDAVSGATTVVGGSGSDFEEDRNEFGFNYSYTQNDTTLGAGYYYGEEPDYKSKSLLLSWDQSLFDKNLTLSTRVASGQDNADSSGNGAFDRNKTMNRLVLAATQLLSPRSLIVGGMALEHQQGYLSSSTRRIVIETFFPGGGGVRTVYDENHPDERLRQVYFLRAKQYFDSRSALDVNLSHYADDWGISAQSAEFRLSRYLTPELIGRVRYRYYTQTAADFYQENYTQQEAIMTADYRLRAYDSALYGIKLSYYLRWFNNASVSLSYDTYAESNEGIDGNLLQVWLNMPY
ncbi:MAG: DUF3570 domain-containing protein [Gammaproteobacteria bacterium]|nr:DUF3570 domain-containing protein [Gammaproteobacteria bacterium]MDH5799504.1 DUF3570 domain-containing protein [Gammaproteobacteria bacterium]